MKKLITRKRYIIVYNNKFVMCHDDENYYFEELKNVENAQIKKYSDKKKASIDFEHKWGKPMDDRYSMVKIKEVIKIKKKWYL